MRAQHHLGMVRLADGAAIGPDDGRSQERTRCVEQHRAVHLATDGHYLDLVTPRWGSSKQPLYRSATSQPPMLGILLRPAKLGASDVVSASHRGANPATLVHQSAFQTDVPAAQTHPLTHCRLLQI